MPRKVKDATLETRTARAKLKPGRKPYYRALAPGLHLGYRKGQTGGVWLVRWYQKDGQYRLKNLDVIADDHLEADGTRVLTFGQAQEAAQNFYRKQTGVEPVAGPLTVRAAVEAYIGFLKAERSTADDTEYRLEKHILPAIGDKLITGLKQAEIERVKRAMVRSDPDDPEVERRAKDSANRVLSMLKAALNMAFADDANHIPTDKAWRAVKPFRGVGRARQVHLSPAQSRRLINVCEGRFRDLVTATLLTGARAPGELALLRVKHFDPKLRMLSVRDGKTGQRDVVLTREAVQWFETITAGRDPDSLLLPKDDDSHWGKSHQFRPMREAVKRAKLPEDTCLYSLRHTYASQSILAGMNLKMLAENMGTSIRMLEQHYGKFIAVSRRKLVEESAFKVGLRIPKGTVVPMAGKR